jgi:CBS domain-containing protein
MSTQLIIAEPGDEIAGLAAAMLRRDIEVLAVVEEEKIIGMLLLRDLMRHQIELLTAEIENLREYLSSLQDAMMD